MYPIPMEAFDADPFLFNCQNGTMHLKDMTFRSHDPEDKLTKISGVVYDPTARCERFDTFVDEIMSGDGDRARFLQRSLGYALSGDARFECLFILYGATTRNGKGTLMESVLRVIGTCKRYYHTGFGRLPTGAEAASAESGLPACDQHEA